MFVCVCINIYTYINIYLRTYIYAYVYVYFPQIQIAHPASPADKTSTVQTLAHLHFTVSHSASVSVHWFMAGTITLLLISGSFWFGAVLQMSSFALLHDLL